MPYQGDDPTIRTVASSALSVEKIQGLRAETGVIQSQFPGSFQDLTMAGERAVGSRTDVACYANRSELVELEPSDPVTVIDGTAQARTFGVVRSYGHPAHKKAYFPDPGEPIDRWHQAANSSNVRNTITMIKDLCRKHGHQLPETLVDPFTGAGSTAVAARVEGLRFFGIEIDPVLACIATAKMSARGRRSVPAFVDSATDELADECLDVLRSTSDVLNRPSLRANITDDLANARQDPALGTIICGDTTLLDTWKPASAITGSTVIYTSPPFGHTAQKAPWSEPTHDHAVRALTQAGRYMSDRSQDETSDYRSFVIAMLRNAQVHLRGALAIIEHEPAYHDRDDRAAIAEGIERDTEATVLRVYESKNFSHKGMLSFFVCQL